jgi:hypothetical protein
MKSMDLTVGDACIYTRFALFSLISVTFFHTKGLCSCGSV